MFRPPWVGRFLDADAGGLFTAASNRSRRWHAVKAPPRIDPEPVPGQEGGFPGGARDFNNKAKLSTKMAHGYGTFKMFEITLYHRLGYLPEPEFTHRFFWRDI
jgi:hypothetical protein